MARSRKKTNNDGDIVHKFALAMERGRFVEYIETLQNTRKLMWKSFVSGLARGFGAVIGATIVVALIVGLLAWLGGAVPGEIGDFFSDTGSTIKGE